ncbi:MAG: DUF350 domain-containing protein [Gordonia sp. (in: high G+C Gram-positive bacteria)]|uniref:DUF350 domain-containing protein n=1 Tax=Gordonia sp. (in: high G+C Gram-positive bacteria) TaxID=84139 RepID=UPI0039E2C467
MKSLLLNNLAEIASYGLLGILVLILGYIALDVVTPGKLKITLWEESQQDGVILTAGFLVSLGVVYAAAVRAGGMTEYLWQGLLFAFIYSIAAIALMIFAYFLIDWLTPHKLGELLMNGNSAIVWVPTVVFVALGVAMASVL